MLNPGFLLLNLGYQLLNLGYQLFNLSRLSVVKPNLSGIKTSCYQSYDFEHLSCFLLALYI